MKQAEIKEFLDEQVEKYNNTSFIASDPISIPHLFEKKEDIEIIGLIVATISWGNRKSIIKNSHQLVDIMGNQPHEFILNHSESDLKDMKFVHRTFNAEDLKFFFRFARSVYSKNNSIEDLFKGDSAKERIIYFRTRFLETKHEKRSEKHVSNPAKGSAAKRLNMYLRWMVRDDNKGVDFGIWKNIPSSELMIPLDVHTGNVARKLGLIKRTSNDWTALEELMSKLRKYDPNDPCKYDYALFGVGLDKLI